MHAVVDEGGAAVEAHGPCRAVQVVGQRGRVWSAHLHAEGGKVPRKEQRADQVDPDIDSLIVQRKQAAASLAVAHQGAVACARRRDARVRKLNPELAMGTLPHLP